jgi:phenylalanyl-tRNA synthetase alpha chain
MLEKIEELLGQVQQFHTKNKEEIEKFRIAFIGKKGSVTELLRSLKMFRMNRKKNSDRKLIP